jgi:hypothetical protein
MQVLSINPPNNGLKNTGKKGAFGLLTIYRLIIKKGYPEEQTQIWFKLIFRFPH